MIDYKTGDVILTEVVFSEKIGSKKRPALIISSEDYNKNRQDVIIAAITSNITRKLYGDTLINEWKEAGLKFPSLVAGIVQTIKNSMVINKLGVLSKEDFKKVKLNLKKSFISF